MVVRTRDLHWPKRLTSTSVNMLLASQCQAKWGRSQFVGRGRPGRTSFNFLAINRGQCFLKFSFVLLLQFSSTMRLVKHFDSPFDTHFHPFR